MMDLQRSLTGLYGVSNMHMELTVLDALQWDTPLVRSKTTREHALALGIY